MLNISTNRRTAFTLIELLAVMAILAVLIALLMPALDRVRRAAWGASCRSNLRQMGQAMTAYAADYDGLLPFYGEPAGFGWPKGGGSGRRNSFGAQWDVQIAPYLGLNWVWGSTTPPAELGNNPTVFYCPGGMPWHPTRTRTFAETQSYNYNARIGQNIRNSRRLSQLEDSERTFLIADAHRNDDWAQQWGHVCLAATYIGRQHAGLIRFQDSTPHRFCYHRHNDRINVLFAAGHVDTRPLSPDTYQGEQGFPAGVRFGNGYRIYAWP